MLWKIAHAEGLPLSHGVLYTQTFRTPFPRAVIIKDIMAFEAIVPY